MATTPSELPPPDPRAGRLHPFSWLFVLLINLRQVALPLVVLLVFGRGEGWELWGAAGAVGLALYSVLYSFGFRYELGASEIVVREGIFARTERHVPFERIQNVVQKRNPLHRMFGVCELVLESAGSGKPEAKMSVISDAEALRIERILRGRTAAEQALVDAEPAIPLLALDAREIVRLGLATNRGIVVIGAAFALVSQFQPWERGAMRASFAAVGDAMQGWTGLLTRPLSFAAGLLVFGLAFFVVLKLLSIVVAFVAFHGFTLTRSGDRIGTVGGLLTRHAASARLDKIQRLVHAESWLARRMARHSLSCDVAAGRAAAGQSDSTRLKWLAPIATPGQIRAIVAEIAPGLDLDGLEWRPLHDRAWQRMFRPALVFWTLAAIGPAYAYGPGVALPWALVVALSFLDARGTARFAGYAVSGGVFAYRSGWLTRQWAIARIEKGQTVRLARSPFDRRAGMGTVTLDTAGAPAAAFQLRVPYLAEAEARELAARLRAAM